MLKKKLNTIDILYLIFIIAFFYLPIVYVVVFSFNSSKSLTAFTGFSTRWYETMFKSHTMMESIYYTVLVAVIATVVSTIIGTITAIGLSKSRRILREVALQVNNLPMLNPDIVTAIGLMLLFVAVKAETGLLTMILAHITFDIPYVIVTIMPKLRSLDDNVAEAALDLGATPWQALTKAILPQIKDAILAGALIAFTMSFDDFVISFFTTGPGINNISIYVYTMYKRINPSINALSSIIILAITTVLLLINVVPMLRKKTVDEYAKEPNPKTKWVWAGVAACLLIGVVGYRALSKGDTQTLNVYNAGEYIDEEVLANFEAAYNCKVNYSTFASNEEMYTKLMSGTQYDVVIPSDYMIQKLLEEDMLQPIDHSIIQNLDSLTPAVMNLDWDPTNEYSVPYFWGNVGIVYDTTKVDYEDLEKDGFAIFKNTKYKGQIFMYDNERDAFMIALKDLGYSMNTDNEEEILAAYDWLTEMAETMEPSFVTDESIDGMINGEKWLALMYSGDAAYICSENEDMGFYVPDYGTNVWVDAMIIPANAQNYEMANEYINYMLTYEAAVANSEYVGYTSPVQEVMDELSSEEGTYYGIDAYLPREDNENDESYETVEVLRKMIADLWVKVKLH